MFLIKPVSQGLDYAKPVTLTPNDSVLFVPFLTIDDMITHYYLCSHYLVMLTMHPCLFQKVLRNNLICLCSAPVIPPIFTTKPPT